MGTPGSTPISHDKQAIPLDEQSWLVLLNSVVLRLLVPMGAVGVALAAQSRSWGLFNNVSIPDWLTVVISVVALDFAIYLQHVLFHAIPLFWRLRMVHHADLDFDVTTGLRFHTIEIVFSYGLKCAAIQRHRSGTL